MTHAQKLSVTLSDYFLGANTPPPSSGEPGDFQDTPTPALAPVTLGDLLTLAGDRTFCFLFLVLSIPSALPLPAPGYSVPFGILIALLALQWIWGSQEPWIPTSWRSKGFDRHQVQKLIKASIPWLKRMEAVSRPRLRWVCNSPASRWIFGAAILLMAISMIIPIPGTNTLPAMGIFVVSFGLFDDDGAIVLGGLTLCLMGACLTTLILLFGYEAVKLGLTNLIP